MGVFSSGSDAVDAMGQIVITGNITPPRWYKEILKENGRPDHLAVAILSDIVYWYRPTEVRDEASGYVTGLRKKFKGDLLQKTYEQYGQFFGEKKRIIKESMDRLEKLGLIRKVFRDIVLESGIKIPNVMYIEIFPDRIREITEEETAPGTSGPTVQKLENGVSDVPASEAYKPSQTADLAGFAGGGTEFRTTSPGDSYDLPRNNVPCPTQNPTHVIQADAGHHPSAGGTNTYNTTKTREEITTQNTTEITQGEYSQVKSSPAADVDNSDDDAWMDGIDWSKPIKVTMQKTENSDMTGQDKTDRDIYIEILRDQMEYPILISDPSFERYRETIDGIIGIIADIATTEPLDGYEIVNKRKYPHEVVKSRLLKMDYMTITHVLNRLKKNTTEIKSLRNYLITTLYNARDEMDISVDAEVRHDMHAGII